MSTERPHISEKVKFWEEQDRINTALIPRVLKQHELFTSHIEGHQDSNMIISAMEARMNTTMKTTQRRFMLISGASLCISILALAAAVTL